MSAIDISETSLRYARRQCAAAGLRNIQFAPLDLHSVGELGREFHAIYCSGVLHHLPSPEQGWAALAAVLRPGGVMRICLYSRIGRLAVAAARAVVRDLLGGPVDDGLLRRVRQRLLNQTTSQWMLRCRDFYSLSGTHDLLLHRHEDPFDIPRIASALDTLGLQLLSFSLPTPDAAARYNRLFPDDRLHRNVGSWLQFEKSEPFVFQSMYRFWCRRPASGEPAPDRSAMPVGARK